MAVTLSAYAPFDSGAGANVTEATWRDFMQHVLDTGVIANIFNEFELYADSSGMQVKVRTGEAWIKGHWGRKDTETTLAIAANATGVTRYDRVVLRCDFVNNRMELDVLTGTAVPPGVDQNSSRWDVSLGVVQVLNGAVTIAADKIIDERTLVVPGGRQPFIWPRVTPNAAPGSPGQGGSTTFTVASVVINDPGYPYYIEAGASLLAGIFSGANTTITGVYLQINLDEAAFVPTPDTRIILRSIGGTQPAPQIIDVGPTFYRSVLTGNHTVYLLLRNESSPSNFLTYADNGYFSFFVKMIPAR